MTATANADSTFVGWRGALDGTSSPVTLTMTRDMDVVASFELARFEVYLPLVLKD